MSADRNKRGTAIQPVETDQVPTLKADHLDAIVAAAEQSHAPATRDHYRYAWRIFEAWCAEHGYASLPADPAVVAAYLVERADRISISGVKLDRAAIRHKHVSDGLDSPTNSPGVATVMRGLRRQAAGSPPQQAKGLTATDLAAIKATAFRRRSGPTGRTESEEAARRRGAVDIALISVMRDAMLRRSEAAALTWADVEFRTDETARVTVRQSKTDQEGEGAVLFVGRDATTALEAIRPDEHDPDARVFGLHSGNAISVRIRKAAAAAGLRGKFTGHSPRVGMSTDLVAAGASVAAVQVAGRWKSSRMPGQYARGELAGQGAVARYYGGNGE